MSDKPALNATFFAFQKRDGAVLLPASIAFAIAMIVVTALIGVAAFYLLGGLQFVDWYRDSMANAAKGGSTQMPPNMGAIFLIFPIEMVAAFIYAVLFASYESACLRWMIRGERSGPLNLYFGADMWRVYATYWVWFLFFVGSTILFWIVMLALGVAGSAVGGHDNPAVAGLVVAVGCVVWILAWIYTAARLAPAAAACVGGGHFAPQRGWSVSRDRFWALFGAFVLLLLIYFVAGIVVGSIAMGPFYAWIFNHIDWSMMQKDPAGFSRTYQEANMQAMQNMFATPTSIALYIGGQVALYAVALVYCLLSFGVNARAAQAALEEGKLAHEPPAS